LGVFWGRCDFIVDWWGIGRKGMHGCGGHECCCNAAVWRLVDLVSDSRQKAPIMAKELAVPLLGYTIADLSTRKMNAWVQPCAQKTTTKTTKTL
jgi:hypothetical protein